VDAPVEPMVRVLTTGPITGGSETILLAEDAEVIDVQLFVHLSGRPAGGGVRPKHLEALMRFKLLVVAAARQIVQRNPDRRAAVSA
jgi:hypothetical protein